GNDLHALVDPRFGRCNQFIVFDSITESFEVIDNKQNLNAAQGAGIQSAQTVANSGSEVLISGHCGPKAFKVLTQANIKVFTCQDLTIKESITQFLAGDLVQAEGADVEGHWV
ncbi:MAG: NifB/NifX family molybdenum-iron cluster-binding protein, partial [Lentisphaeria bacterium]|nr:NifB/NifX family molybdenum-iron cluster-binding protein [Lentisphaeria bacterium]